MEWPRIIYHTTDGITRSEHGYTYQRCDTQEEFDRRVKLGWTLSPDDLYKAQEKPKSVKDVNMSIVPTALDKSSVDLNSLIGPKKAAKKAGSRKR